MDAGETIPEDAEVFFVPRLLKEELI